MRLRGAIFKKYSGSWQNLERELDELAQVAEVPKEEFSLYMKGLNNSLSVASRVRLCEYLALDPNDFPELMYRPDTD